MDNSPIDSRSTGYNSTFAIGGVSSFAVSFVVKGSSVLWMNISAEKPAHRKSAKRYEQVGTRCYISNKKIKTSFNN